MHSLLRKELRSVAPFLALVLFFVALNWLFILLAEYPDQYPLSLLLSDDARNTTQILTFILAFALASGLLVREQDEGTLAFLDGLPVSRAQIFVCKCAVALSVLWLLPISDLVFNATFHALSRTSLDRDFHWDILLTATLLDGTACISYLSIGLALSFLRRFSLLVLGLLIWALVLLHERGVSFALLLDILSLGIPVFEGQRWLLPWSKLGAQLALALACATAAFVAFQFTGDGAQRLTAKLKRRRGGVLLAGLGPAVAVTVWIGLWAYWGWKSDHASGPRVRYADWTIARANTASYEFLYPENRGALVNQIIDRADAAEAKVREFLQATSPGQIIVDMTAMQPRHAGRAYWKKVHMNLPFEADATGIEALISVLGHETAHVYLDHLSSGRLHDRFESTRFFHEGLASWVEYHLFLPPEKLVLLRRVAAVMRARDEVEFEELIQDQKLSLRLDRDLVYPLGEVFVAALIKRYGKMAPGKVARAFAREDMPKDLAGFALWQDAFQSCHFNLSDVTDEFFAELDRIASEQSEFAPSLPRLRGAVEKRGSEIIVRGLYAGRAPGAMVCRFRPGSDTADRFYELRFAEDENTFRVDRSDYTERSFWYQLGWQTSETSQIVYESWVEGR